MFCHEDLDLLTISHSHLPFSMSGLWLCLCLSSSKKSPSLVTRTIVPTLLLVSLHFTKQIKVTNLYRKQDHYHTALRQQMVTTWFCEPVHDFRIEKLEEPGREDVPQDCQPVLCTPLLLPTGMEWKRNFPLPLGQGRNLQEGCLRETRSSVVLTSSDCLCDSRGPKAE